MQKLYEAVATESVAVENIGSTYSDDESEEGINIDTNDNNHADKNNTNSLPATPPPSSAYEVKMSDTDQDKDFREIQTLLESPPKKPKLRF